MQIQGENLDYLNIEQFTQQVFGETQHAKRIQSLAGAALGILSSSSLIIHRIGQGLARENNLMAKHAIKQVDRLLSNKQLSALSICLRYFSILSSMSFKRDLIFPDA